jgi:ferredoxin
VKRTLLVGTGPSGYSVLSSLEHFDDIWIMDGQTAFNSNAISTRSHLALKQKFGSSHTYVDSESLGLKENRSFQLPISYSRGGFGEIWGNGFTPYDIFELMPEDSDDLYSPLLEAMKELLDRIPFSHSESELDYRFGKLENWSNSKTTTGINLHPLFVKFLNRRKKSKTYDLLFGQPNLLLDPNKCTKCGLCLTGCPYGALFDPGEHVNKMIYSRKISSDRFIRGILKRIDLVETGVVVTYLVDGIETTQDFDEVILAAGPLSTALILINSGLLPDNFFVPDSQVFYGAFFSLRRFRREKESQEVGQIVCYPLNKSEGDFQVTLYSPSETSRTRISNTIFPDFSSLP